MVSSRSVARGSLSGSQGRLSETLVLGVVLLALAALSGFVAYAAGPAYIPLMALGLIGGALVVRRPEIGVFAMFVMLLFKPEAIQGLGFLGPNALISLVLASLLFVSVLGGGPTDFLRSNQIRGYVLLGALFAVNWALVGRVEAPAGLADLDHTARSMYRYVVHLSVLVFLIAFVRTKRQLLVLTGLFIAAILVTIPGALSATSEIETKVTALRAAAVGAVRSAENANRLAFMCLMGISVVWFAIQYYRSRLLRAGGALLILFLVLTVFRSGSRSGVLNLILLVGLILLQSRVNPANFGLTVIAAMVGVTVLAAFADALREASDAFRNLLVPDVVLQRLLSVFAPEDAQFKSVALGDAGRLAILGAGLALVIQHPILGVGIGNFRWMTSDQSGIVTAAHNAYVLAAAEGGLPMLAVYLLIFWITARDLNRALRQSAREPEVDLRWLVLATRTNLVLLLVVSLFAEAWKEFYILLIMGTAGVLAGIYGRAAAGRARQA
jgi:O-antigen ligase